MSHLGPATVAEVVASMGPELVNDLVREMGPEYTGGTGVSGSTGVCISPDPVSSGRQL